MPLELDSLTKPVTEEVNQAVRGFVQDARRLREALDARND